MNDDPVFDVVGVQVQGQQSTIRVMGKELTRDNANAYVRMAIARRGVDEEFFAVVPAGLYKDGDIYGSKS